MHIVCTHSWYVFWMKWNIHVSYVIFVNMVVVKVYNSIKGDTDDFNNYDSRIYYGSHISVFSDYIEEMNVSIKANPE